MRSVHWPRPCERLLRDVRCLHQSAIEPPHDARDAAEQQARVATCLHALEVLILELRKIVLVLHVLAEVGLLRVVRVALPFHATPVVGFTAFVADARASPLAFVEHIGVGL